MKQILITITILLLASGCAKSPTVDNNATSKEPSNTTPSEIETSSQQEFNFEEFSKVYKFDGSIPNSWAIEYIPTLESINIYDTKLTGTNLEKSQIFIRYFNANKFLTLNTVNILSQESLTLQSRDAIRYEIQKKSGIPNFPGQPTWRNERHSVTDIRHSVSNPSYFYVFAKNPNLPESDFNNFISSLVFH